MKVQLAYAFDELGRTGLDSLGTSGVERRSGVYQLWLRDERVYVGKARGDLLQRLAQHRDKIAGRTPGLLKQVTFNCVYLEEDLDSVAPERMLIDLYRKGVANTVPWNTMGFGNKDPGRNRDRTVVKAGHFDASYPINLELDSLGLTFDDRSPLLDVLEVLKARLPYLLRFPSRVGQDALALRRMQYRGPTRLDSVSSAF